jgi:hypothetical protein
MTMRNDRVASDAMTIVPSDTTQLGLIGFYVGGTGDVTVVTGSGSTVTFKACPVGFKVELVIAQIKSTGTTATLLVGLLP